jgi:C4-dicarboxylate-specific signal transduction histidine kinase
LQRVILKLLVNSMDAMSSIHNGQTVVARTEPNARSPALISISDSSPEISSETFNEIVNPFFTSKQQEMRIGLSIAGITAHADHGRIWGGEPSQWGPVFRVSLLLSSLS